MLQLEQTTNNDRKITRYYFQITEESRNPNAESARSSSECHWWIDSFILQCRPSIAPIKEAPGSSSKSRSSRNLQPKCSGVPTDSTLMLTETAIVLCDTD
ncbi:hypothetical protein CBL_13472 [Carabus blaptoides fortunei]